MSKFRTMSPPSNECVEDDTNFDVTEDENLRSEVSKRGRGSPRILKTDEKGHPRKQYQIIIE